jgi:hypothetical protein
MSSAVILYGRFLKESDEDGMECYRNDGCATLRKEYDLHLEVIGYCWWRVYLKNYLECGKE